MQSKTGGEVEHGYAGTDRTVCVTYKKPGAANDSNANAALRHVERFGFVLWVCVINMDVYLADWALPSCSATIPFDVVRWWRIQDHSDLKMILSLDSHPEPRILRHQRTVLLTY